MKAILLLLPFVFWGPLALAAAGAVSLAFQPGDDGGFTFDTGTLRGRLRAGGASLGLQQVVHQPSGRRIDRGHGLLGHYRVFANGKRFGGGAWDWPGTARQRPDGSVEVRWPATTERPFTLEARYRWNDPSTIDVETTVTATSALRGFEVFLASYFDEAFTEARVCVASPETSGIPSFVQATREAGEWQMYPRNDAVIPLLRDGRWQLEPHPVAWVLRPRFALPVIHRRAAASGLSGLLMAPAGDCFALATPHQTEEHYSAYLSLFGEDVPAGGTTRARARLRIAVSPTDATVMDAYVEASREWLRER